MDMEKVKRESGTHDDDQFTLQAAKFLGFTLEQDKHQIVIRVQPGHDAFTVWGTAARHGMGLDGVADFDGVVRSVSHFSGMAREGKSCFARVLQIGS